MKTDKIKWYTVDEKLPEPYKEVLCTCDDGHLYVGTGFHVRDGLWINEGGSDVIAWAEMPEPYEVKDED